MKTPHYFILALLLLGNITAAQIPVEKEKHHKVVLENDYMRLLEGKVPYRDTTVAHIHSAESVVVFLSKSTFGIGVKGEKPAIADVNPGDLRYVAYGTKPVTHTVWNQTEPEFHFLVVELKQKSAQSELDKVLFLPGVKLQIQEKLVNVYSLDIPKDGKITIPKSYTPHLLINISGSTMSSAPGIAQIMTGSGFFYYPPGNPIEIKSRNNENAKCVLVEFK
jgi:hypothetical protein